MPRILHDQLDDHREDLMLQGRIVAAWALASFERSST